MSPQEQYQQSLKNGTLQADDEQARLVSCLQTLYLALSARASRPWWRLTRPTKIKGLYVWGGVGIGKTHLMDIFYQSLPTTRKSRLHFHHFMRQIHTELTALEGTPNPLTHIAKRWANAVDVLCFDEFHVTDIVDAMLLGNLLAALFAYPIVLVTTSNTAPDDLYRHGLQRERFLPAIALLKQHTDVVHLSSQMDYRLRTHQQSGTYYCPVNADTRLRFKQHFVALAGKQVVWHQALTIDCRSLATMAYAQGVVWLQFATVVCVPQSQRDYLELARDFHTVFISDVPAIAAAEDDVVCNFIKLVDIFYDAQVKLILQAAVPIEQLYTDGKMRSTFVRTQSRLTEMQSSTYLAQPHRMQEDIHRPTYKSIE